MGTEDTEDHRDIVDRALDRQATRVRRAGSAWADLLRDCARPGMRTSMLAVGDGALGFWGAPREVFPATREQRRWFHKIANVLGALPKTAGAPSTHLTPSPSSEPTPPCTPHS